jgi:hypothetical protein
MNQGLSSEQINQFIIDGFVKLEKAFPSELAEEICQILWKDLEGQPENPATWHKPVIRLGDYADEPFRNAANTPILQAAFDQLVGIGRWIPRRSLGTFPVRFPVEGDPGDTGWHVDAGFPGENGDDFFSWRINLYSKGRALLMLFLFSDTGVLDAPTRIRIGSHLDVARIIESRDREGMSFMELANNLDLTAHRPEILATGKAGSVYLCHPFLVHAAQVHRGEKPRFLAQPPLYPVDECSLHRTDGSYSPVEIAIRKGIGLDP